MTDLHKEFPITSICRGDLEVLGYDSSKVSDAQMQQLASRMETLYLETDKWKALRKAANELGIVKKVKL